MILYAALVATLPLALVVAAAGALAGLSGPINPLYETVIHEQTPPQMLGRVFGAVQALAFAGIPVGTALAGFAVAGLGLTPTITARGVIYVAVTLSMFFRPALRRLDVRPIGGTRWGRQVCRAGCRQGILVEPLLNLCDA